MESCDDDGPTAFRIPIDSGRSASPYLGSENGNVSDDNSSGKVKAKSKGKFAGIVTLQEPDVSSHCATDEADFNLKRKRVGDPVRMSTSHEFTHLRK